jgi:CRISPR/Cas system-associated protein Cas7 (RAMP superfamily)
VRSKIDLDIQNAEKDGELEIDIVEKIMSKFSDNLKHAGLKKSQVFCNFESQSKDLSIQ